MARHAKDRVSADARRGALRGTTCPPPPTCIREHSHSSIFCLPHHCQFAPNRVTRCQSGGCSERDIQAQRGAITSERDPLAAYTLNINPAAMKAIAGCGQSEFYDHSHPKSIDYVLENHLDLCKRMAALLIGVEVADISEWPLKPPGSSEGPGARCRRNTIHSMLMLAAYGIVRFHEFRDMTLLDGEPNTGHWLNAHPRSPFVFDAELKEVVKICEQRHTTWFEQRISQEDIHLREAVVSTHAAQMADADVREQASKKRHEELRAEVVALTQKLEQRDQESAQKDQESRQREQQMFSLMVAVADKMGVVGATAPLMEAASASSPLARGVDAAATIAASAVVSATAAAAAAAASCPKPELMYLSKIRTVKDLYKTWFEGHKPRYHELELAGTAWRSKKHFSHAGQVMAGKWKRLAAFLFFTWKREQLRLQSTTMAPPDYTLLQAAVDLDAENTTGKLRERLGGEVGRFENMAQLFTAVTSFEPFVEWTNTADLYNLGNSTGTRAPRPSAAKRRRLDSGDASAAAD
jgi:hypothetical protein